MAKYDDFKESSKNQPASQRLAALRIEMMTPLAVIHGFATILGRINLEDPSTFPKDYSYMVERIMRAHDDIYSVMEILTSDIPSE